jgi:hypothetical protein
MLRRRSSTIETRYHGGAERVQRTVGPLLVRGIHLGPVGGPWRVLEGVGIKVQDENRRLVFKVAASDPTDLHAWTFA